MLATLQVLTMRLVSRSFPLASTTATTVFSATVLNYGVLRMAMMTPPHTIAVSTLLATAWAGTVPSRTLGAQSVAFVIRADLTRAERKSGLSGNPAERRAKNWNGTAMEPLTRFGKLCEPLRATDMESLMRFSGNNVSSLFFRHGISNEIPVRGAGDEGASGGEMTNRKVNKAFRKATAESCSRGLSPCCR